MKTLAVYNIKGGVGKTTTTINLAYLAAKEGHKTLLWDLDAQGAATFYLKIKPEIKGGSRKLIKAKVLSKFIKETDIENLDILPADFSYRNLDIILDDEKKSTKRLKILLSTLSKDYDLIFLDSPPNVSLLSENIFNAADFIITPVIPTTLSLRTYEQIDRYFLKEMEKPPTMLPFFSMADRRKSMHKEIMFKSGIAGILNSIIPYSSIIEKMGVELKPVEEFAANTIASKAYKNLWGEIKRKADIGDEAKLQAIFGK